ncbi:molybdopterin-binding protein [uncultured Chryseobacterium sp.]|uniref:molybdopterin-binding protein n=1 Tax=uncultured Chryseobacterium sp. TaxID=259322 RepID=UPI0025E89109|nr:molybdopterin-binding protein [uncultured Chryseobacterium sp.]
MKYTSILLLFITVWLSAQKLPSVKVTGTIEKPVIVSLEDLKKYETHQITSIDILNHKLEFKKNLKNLKGVLLKDLLEQVKFNAASPKDLSMFYLVCIAEDGYKVVYSWNEIFNSTAEKQAMLITGTGGTSIADNKEGITLITPGDKATGRRYVKNLSEIIINKVD